jgi:hypothetical protein
MHRRLRLEHNGISDVDGLLEKAQVTRAETSGELYGGSLGLSDVTLLRT